MIAHTDLSVHDILALREIALKGRLPANAGYGQLHEQGLVEVEHAGAIRLTEKGRHLLVRGSPLLWNGL